MKIKRKKTAWIIVIVLVIALIAGFKIFSKKPEQYISEKVQKGTLVNTISATGELKANQEIDLNFEITGRLKEILVKTGNEVATGEILASIENSVLSKKAESAKYALGKAIADASSNNDTVREDKQTVENAEDYLDQVKELENQKVDAAEEDYAQASNYYDDALSYYNQIKADNGTNSSTTKNAKLTLTSAQKQKNAAEEALQTAKKTRDLNIVSAENSLKSAKEGLDTSQSFYAKTSRDSTVAQARASYEIALANLDDATLSAPVNGVITKINYEKGEVLGAGTAQTPFGKLLSKDYILEINIPESDITQIKIGQNAKITFDSLNTEDIFSAQVIEIDPASTVIQDVVYYRAKLKLNNFDPRLKPGMSADADIETAKKENVITISEQAVRKENNSETVDILLDNNKTKTINIKTGISGDEGKVEIISGLEAGQEVVISQK